MNRLRYLALCATILADATPGVAQQVSVLSRPVGLTIVAGDLQELDRLESQFSTGNIEGARRTAKDLLERARDRARACEPGTRSLDGTQAQKACEAMTLLGRAIALCEAAEKSPNDVKARGACETGRKLAEEAKAEATRPPDGPTPKIESFDYDYTTKLIALAWAGTDVDGTAVLRRMMVTEPSSFPSSLDLPGDGHELYEVLIAADKRARLSSRYSFTRQENPVVAQIPTVAERILTPFFGLFGDVSSDPSQALLGADPSRRGRDAKPVYATANHVVLPFQRAIIEIKTIGRIPAELESWRQDLAKASIEIRFSTAARSKCAVDLVADAETRVNTAASSDVCTANALSQPNRCLEAMAVALDTAFEAGKASCAAGTVPKEDLEAMTAVDNKIREFILKSKAAPVVSELEIRSRPLTHFSFGIATAHIARATLNRDRAKVTDDGNLVADPLPRSMSMVLLNWSPEGYDEDAPSPQRSERIRLFAAGVITPDPGVGLGASILVVRGLGIIAGHSWLFGRGRGDADTFGEAPAKAGDPLAVTRSRAWFVGVSYNFK